MPTLLCVAEFVDKHLIAATDALLDAAGITESDTVLELAAGPGGAGREVNRARQSQRAGRGLNHQPTGVILS